MTDDIVKRLGEGIVEYKRRWSGDCHADLGGSADYEKTQALMDEAAAEITRLRVENEKLKEACQTIKVMFETKWSWSSSHKIDMSQIVLSDVLGGDNATQAPAPCHAQESGQQAVSSGEEASCKDAEIARLRAENEKLRAALKPFANLAVIEDNGTASDAEMWFVFGAKTVSIGDLRAAAAALKETGDE